MDKTIITPIIIAVICIVLYALVLTLMHIVPIQKEKANRKSKNNIFKIDVDSYTDLIFSKILFNGTVYFFSEQYGKNTAVIFIENAIKHYINLDLVNITEIAHIVNENEDIMEEKEINSTSELLHTYAEVYYNAMMDEFNKTKDLM